MTISEQDFQHLLETKLGGSFERAFNVFRNCSADLSRDITNALQHAARQNKVEIVLNMMEAHFPHQDPSTIGILNNSGSNATLKLFIRIYYEVLRLKPNEIWKTFE